MFGRKKVNDQVQDTGLTKLISLQVDEFKRGERKSFESEVPACHETVQALNQLIETDTKAADGVVQGITKLLNDVTGMMYVKDMVLDVNKQTDIVETVAASSQELASSIEDVSHFVQSSASEANETIKQTDNSVAAIESALQESASAIEEFQEIKTSIEKVGEEMRAITEMVDIIKGIADQTNLLALNASIEAARAGEAGRGFAVVADEIKKLAETTKESVEFIEKTTVNLSSGMTQTIGRLETSDKKFADGNREIEKSIGSISGIKGSVDQIYQNMMQISANVEEQTAASEEIASNMMQMLQQTKNLREECDKTGHGLYDLSVKVDKTRIDAWNQLRAHAPLSSIEMCVTDHLIWKWRVYNMILGYSHIDPGHVGDHHSCRLGKWLGTLDKTDSRIGPVIRSMDKPHSDLHQCAKRAAEAYARGNVEEAERNLEEMSVHSEHVIDALDQLRRIMR